MVANQRREVMKRKGGTSKNNSRALRQGPGSTSTDTYNVHLVFITANHIPLGFHVFCLKNDRMISAVFRGKPFNIIVTQVYALITNAEEAEAKQFYKDLHSF